MSQFKRAQVKNDVFVSNQCLLSPSQTLQMPKKTHDLRKTKCWEFLSLNLRWQDFLFLSPSWQFWRFLATTGLSNWRTFREPSPGCHRVGGLLVLLELSTKDQTDNNVFKLFYLQFSLLVRWGTKLMTATGEIIISSISSLGTRISLRLNNAIVFILEDRTSVDPGRLYHG